MVDELVAVVGNTASSSGSYAMQRQTTGAPIQKTAALIHASHHTGSSKISTERRTPKAVTAKVTASGREVDPAKVIPMDDDAELSQF